MYEIDPEVKRDLLNHLVKNEYATHLTSYHTGILEALNPVQQRACVDHTIKKGYKTIFKTGWIREVRVSTDSDTGNQHSHYVDYFGTKIELPIGMVIDEVSIGTKKLKHKELQPYYDERLSEWHEAIAWMEPAQWQALARKHRAELNVIQQGLINDGAQMTEPSGSFEQYLSNKRIGDIPSHLIRDKPSI